MRLLDAGCGGGRNLVYFLRNGFQVFGVDEHPEAVSQVRRLAAQLAPALPATNFQVSDIADIAEIGNLPPGAGRLEGRVTPIQGRWYHLPDGSDRFLVDDAMLTQTAGRLGARWADPLKTTLVQNQRSMTTWVLWKVR